MRKQFTGFYTTPEEDLKNVWNSDSTLFIFDTNCLLNLYRCEDHTRDEILNVMRAISTRTWIPFQVGFEYQRNRREVISDSVENLKSIQKQLEDIYTKNILGKLKKHLYSSLSEEISTLQKKIMHPVDEFIKTKITPRIEKKEAISQHDTIRIEIDNIINENVGSKPSQVKIDEINKKGEDRYKNNIPPGYKDNIKNAYCFFEDVRFENKYGDLYLWEEIIEKSKSEHIKNVIFICDDNKEDWWFKHDGKKHGPLEPLKTEICNKSGIDNFKLINQLTFLHEAEKYLSGIKVSSSSLKEVEELSNKEVIDAEFNIYSDKTRKIIENMFRKNINLKYKFANKIGIDKKDERSHLNEYVINTKDEIFNILEDALSFYKKVHNLASKTLENFYLHREELANIIGENKFDSLASSFLNKQKLALDIAVKARNILNSIHVDDSVLIEDAMFISSELYEATRSLERQNNSVDALLDNAL